MGQFRISRDEETRRRNVLRYVTDRILGHSSLCLTVLKKESITDAYKRAFRQFGNAFGLCLCRYSLTQLLFRTPLNA